MIAVTSGLAAERFADDSDPRLCESTGQFFAMLTRDHLVVKLPRTRVSELISSGTGAPFRGGKTAPMKEWLTVTTHQASTWLALAQEAFAFVSKR
jgi:hypothetical protein